MGHTQAAIFLKELDKLRAQKGDALAGADIEALCAQLGLDDRARLYQGVQNIAGKIEQAKIELSLTHPAITHPEKLATTTADANLELDAVVKATEEAAHRIMDAAEAIQAVCGTLGESQEATEINEQVTNLFIACDFQDITGQRISKVVKTLKEIEGCVQELLDAISGKVSINATPAVKEKTRPDEDLMNGPQLNAPNQDDIDKLFAQS